jgi:phenylpropionate dioxygenase-like ring-hydroxylating dioxygenase large terminal subunit
MSLRDFWYIAAEARSLKNRPMASVLLGDSVVLFRDGDGRVQALEDRCAHRNAPLSAGRVANGCLECPYHGWRYDGQGGCVHIPSLGEGAKLPRHTVRSYPAQEQDGYVWLYMGEGVPASGPFRFPHAGERGWSTFNMKTRFQTDVEACLENFLDCPHTAYVHQGWFRSHDTSELKAHVRARDGVAEVEFADEPVSDSLITRLFYPRGRKPKHTDRFIMPSVSRVDYEFGPDRHFIISSACTPVGDWETQVYTVVSFCFGRIAPLVRLAFEPMARRILQQDVDILTLHGQQMRQLGGPRYAHVETDLLGLEIQRMRRRCARGEAPHKEVERDVIMRF